MTKSVFSVRELLDEELERRFYASNIHLKAEELFDKDKTTDWIRSLVGSSVSGKLDACIRDTPSERLSHTAASYLLGMALRTRLGLHFDRMPRIIAHSASDGFHFFWSMICLCHDLGYYFENRSSKEPDILKQMNTAAGRRALLKLNYDLFDVGRAELLALGIDPNSEDGTWILKSVELAKKYDRFRRQTNHKYKEPVADHGICGALLIYDIFRAEYEEMCRKHSLRLSAQPKRHDEKEPAGNLDGAAKDSSPTRFIRCALLIACTVARHNMWVAKEDRRPLYRIYGLEALFADRPGVKIRADLPMEQLLFFLDFVDTIDPLKAFYLRDVEHGPNKGEPHSDYEARLARQYDFVLDRVFVDFSVPSGDPGLRSFAVSSTFTEPWEANLFSGFCHSTGTLPDWLDIPAPTKETDRIIYKLPFIPARKKVWPCNITDREVNSLLLYMGCGVPGRYERFYASSRAYQTFNLLMMRGMDGEKIRVCEEHQRPNGIFLKEWNRSLETMEAIFRAQCKYASGKPPVEDVLFRSDRKLNFDLMCDRNATYAMTSTSQGSYLPEFLVGKVEPHILRITMKEKIPYFDYEGFFGKEYIYADEREILLPPMVRMEGTWISSFPLTDAVRGATSDTPVQWYDVALGSFAPDIVWEDDKNGPDDRTDRDYLRAHAEEAADALDDLAKTHDWKTSPLSNEDHVYWNWKRAYRRVLTRGLQEIYLSEFNK